MLSGDGLHCCPCYRKWRDKGLFTKLKNILSSRRKEYKENEIVPFQATHQRAQNRVTKGENRPKGNWEPRLTNGKLCIRIRRSPTASTESQLIPAPPHCLYLFIYLMQRRETTFYPKERLLPYSEPLRGEEKGNFFFLKKKGAAHPTVANIRRK